MLHADFLLIFRSQERFILRHIICDPGDSDSDGETDGCVASNGSRDSAVGIATD
jgi:hypothetical protein